MACTDGGGGEEARTIILAPSTGHPDVQTSEDRKLVDPQLTPKIDSTREAETVQVDTGRQTPPAGGHDTLPPETTPETMPQPDPHTETGSPSGPVVSLGGVSFRVELAVTSQERVQGLSGHAPLAADEGMLFVFEKPQKYSFWMREMLFPLDMIWIDAECTVAHITRNAPPQAPDQSLSDLPMYGPPVPVLYVLEINAGEAESAAVAVGSPVRFTGSLFGVYGC
jgi:uncharacterized membrane protein (UPF0127 family)